MNIICRSLYYQYILDRFHFFKSPKTFRVIITIILYKYYREPGLDGTVDMVIDHKHNPTDVSLYPILATRVEASSHLSKVSCFTGHFVIPRSSG